MNFLKKSLKLFHQPSIKFIGKRKHLGNVQSNNVISGNDNKNADVTKEVNRAEMGVSSLLKYRTRLDEQEIAIINNGGPIDFPNWTKVKPLVKK